MHEALQPLPPPPTHKAVAPLPPLPRPRLLPTTPPPTRTAQFGHANAHAGAHSSVLNITVVVQRMNDQRLPAEYVPVEYVLKTLLELPLSNMSFGSTLTPTPPAQTIQCWGVRLDV